MSKLPTIILAIIFSNVCLADYIVATRPMHLKEQPSKDSAIVGNITMGEHLDVAEGNEQTNGYYQVTTINGDTGYVYRTVGKILVGSTSEIEVSSNNPLSNTGSPNNNKCDKFFRYGIPKHADQILCRDGYAAGYSYEHKVPIWVIYTITTKSVSANGGDRKLSTFIEDTEIPEQYRSTNKDYAGSGYDKGHMANAAVMDFTQQAVDQSFLLSNMTPQIPEFNRDAFGKKGAWGRLEDQERIWIKKREELYVFAGAIIDDNHATIGDGVAIPNLFYKVIFDPISITAIGFLMPEDKNTGDKLPSYIDTIDNIEERSDSDILSGLNIRVQEVIESDKPSDLWR